MDSLTLRHLTCTVISCRTFSGLQARSRQITRVLDVGCGNGFTVSRFLDFGCQVVGIDLSESGVDVARKAFPNARFEVVAADEKNSEPAWN
jgi:2-polyprenyl-3-methyl-5-hydroxy-6-metoxy-1,4-benzoquinol methylase